MNNRKKIIGILAATSIFTAVMIAGNGQNNRNSIAEAASAEAEADNEVTEAEKASDYEKAKEYMDRGMLLDAVYIFASLGKYSDCKEKIQECKDIAVELVAEGKGISDYIRYGSYQKIKGYYLQNATPGTYSETAEGMNGEVTVDATFDESGLIDVQVDVSCEDEGYGAEGGEVMATQFLLMQSVDVGAVSGATVTSMVVKQAMRKIAYEAIAEDDATEEDTEGENESNNITSISGVIKDMGWISEKITIEGDDGEIYVILETDANQYYNTLSNGSHVTVTIDSSIRLKNGVLYATKLVQD